MYKRFTKMDISELFRKDSNVNLGTRGHTLKLETRMDVLGAVGSSPHTGCDGNNISNKCKKNLNSLKLGVRTTW